VSYTHHSSDSFSSFLECPDLTDSSVDATLDGGRGILPTSDRGDSAFLQALRGLLGGRRSFRGIGGIFARPDGGFFNTA